MSTLMIVNFMTTLYVFSNVSSLNLSPEIINLKSNQKPANKYVEVVSPIYTFLSVHGQTHTNPHQHTHAEAKSHERESVEDFANAHNSIFFYISGVCRFNISYVIYWITFSVMAMAMVMEIVVAAVTKIGCTHKRPSKQLKNLSIIYFV